jgi:hypothetical protein
MDYLKINDKKSKIYHIVLQIGLVFFTVLGFLFTSLKMPQYGLTFNLISQIFGFIVLTKLGSKQVKSVYLSTRSSLPLL